MRVRCRLLDSNYTRGLIDWLYAGMGIGTGVNNAVVEATSDVRTRTAARIKAMLRRADFTGVMGFSRCWQSE